MADLTPAERLEMIGIGEMCARIRDGQSYTAMSRALDISRDAIWRFLNRPENRADRDEALRDSAEAWLDLGLEAIESSMRRDGNIDPSAARAYEQACARRAAIRNPRYRDNSKVEHSGTFGIRRAADMSDDELAAIAAAAAE